LHGAARYKPFIHEPLLKRSFAMIKKSFGLTWVVALILTLCSCAPVTIDTTPSGAEVYSADGQTLLGSTPFKTAILNSDKAYTVRKDRYFEEPVDLAFDAPRNVKLDLYPTPVLVYSKPDAQIFAAGSDTSIGQTPLSMNVENAPRTYTLKAADHFDRDITISLDSPDPLVIELERRPFVTIATVPANAQIYEKGQLLGTAPIRTEILQPRTFEVRKEKHFSKTFVLNGAPPYETTFKLQPFPVITVTASPAGAQILRAGNVLGKGSIKLDVGEAMQLEVRADRYYPQSVTISPESAAQVKVDLKAMPYVTLSSDPAGAEARANGSLIGVTPVELLVEKETSVELSKEGFVSKTVVLTATDRQVSATLDAVPPPTPVITDVPEATVDETEKSAPAKAPASGQPLLWGLGAVALAVIAAIFFILKGKKEE
jgi:hypothetical protein